MITGLYGWHFTAKCQRHFSEREIVSSVRTVQSGTYSQLECLLYIFLFVPYFLSLFPLCIFPCFSSLCTFSQYSPSVLETLVSLFFLSLQLSLRLHRPPQPTSLEGKFCSLISPGTISIWVCVLWLTLDMALCAPLGMQTIFMCVFCCLLGGHIYMFGLEFSLPESFSACLARFSQAHKNQCINIL